MDITEHQTIKLKPSINAQEVIEGYEKAVSKFIYEGLFSNYTEMGNKLVDSLKACLDCERYSDNTVRVSINLSLNRFWDELYAMDIGSGIQETIRLSISSFTGGFLSMLETIIENMEG